MSTPNLDDTAGLGALAMQAAPAELSRQVFVLTADLVGYSELMFRDAEAGIATLMETRGILSDAVLARRGHVVSTPGDFLLAVFEDPVAAVSSAVAAQTKLVERNRATARQPAGWRIGIAFGAVFQIGSDVYGHAVNVAARIQSLARPGDVLITGEVEDQLRAFFTYPMQDLGTQRLKNITAPVEVHRLRWPGLEEAAAMHGEMAVSADLLRRVSKPSLRIEPFEILNHTERNALIARAIEDDIHIVLSRLSNTISVVDRERAGAHDPADYLLKGNLQSAGRHLRLTARLISLASGASLWAERYDCDLREGFAVQDDIAREIVVALQHSLTEGEQARFWRRGTSSGLAWEMFQVGRDHESRYSRDGHRKASECYEEALRLDADYLSALVALGFCRLDDVRLGWSDDDAASVAEAEAAFERASAIDSKHPDVLSLLAFIRHMQGRGEEAKAAMEAAVRKAGQNSEIVGYQAALYDLMGDFPAAIRTYLRALSLTSHARPWVSANLGLSYLASGKAGEAERIYRNVIEHYPGYARAWLGLALALTRRQSTDEARAAAARVLELDPDFSVIRWARSRPFSDSTLLERFQADMRAAGLPP